MSQWYGTNFDGIDQALKEQEARKNQPSRFWLKNGERRRIYFCDEAAFSFREHRILKNPNDWKSAVLETCPGPGCPLCARGEPVMTQFAFTIVDLDGYKDQQGQVQKQNQKYLFVIRPDIADKLRRSKDNWGGLKGHVVEVQRGMNQKDARTGSSFDHWLKDGKAVVVPPEVFTQRGIDAIPFDYLKVLAPKSIQDLNVLYGGGHFFGGGNSFDTPAPTSAPIDPTFSSGNPMDDSDVPF